GDEDNWLPPDNYREGPVEAFSHRTSPTNVGLMLTSTLAARDLGYLTLAELVDRISRSFQTINHLQRYHGHFLNWYDTRAMAPVGLRLAQWHPGCLPEQAGSGSGGEEERADPVAGRRRGLAGSSGVVTRGGPEGAAGAGGGDGERRRPDRSFRRPDRLGRPVG